MLNVSALAYVGGLVLLVGCAVRYPRQRWRLLVLALLYLTLPGVAVVALLLLLSRGNFQFG